MRRTLIAVLVCAALSLGLAACGAAPAAAETSTAAPAAPAENPGTDAAPAQEGISYADSYLEYLAVLGELTDEVERRIEAHNAVLESNYPDSYYMNSNYLMQVYVPFRTAYPALGSALADGRTEEALTSLRTFYPDAELTVTAPGAYEAVYTYLDKTTGQEVARQGRCVWECDGATGALRVRAWLDGQLEEFTEFVPQGGDVYLLYTMTDLALVRFSSGTITELYHAHRISEPPLGTFPGDLRFYSLEEADFFPAGRTDSTRITGDADAQYVFTLSDGDMVYTGRVSQDVLDADGNRTGILWQDIDPIRFLK